MTEITQADREAAAAFYGTWGGTKGWQHLEEPIRKGLVDDNALVRAFARHRIAAEQRGKLEGARLAIEAIGLIVDDYNREIIEDLDPAKIVGEG